MSSNLSGCGQQQTNKINYVQKIDYPYISPWSSPVPDEVAVSGAESDAKVCVVSWVDWSTDDWANI